MAPYEAVVGGCLVLGLVTVFMTAGFDFEDKMEFEFTRKDDWVNCKVALKGFQACFRKGSRMDTGAGGGIHRHGNRTSMSMSLGGWVEVYARIASCVFQNGEGQIRQIQV